MVQIESKQAWRRFLFLLAIAAGYFILARASLFLSFQTSNATPVWPPSGFALAMTLIFGTRVAPAIFVGALAVNLVVFDSNNATTFSTAAWVSFLIGIGNMCESLAGYFLLRKAVRDVRDNNYFKKTSHIFIFTLTAVLISLSASLIGTASVFLGGIITTGEYSIAMLTWWLGDMSGILLVTPFILLWRNFLMYPHTGTVMDPQRRPVKLEIIALFILTITGSGIVFDNWFFSPFVFRWAFWIIPFLVWAGIRARQHEAATVIFLSSAIAVLGTLNGGGPFAVKDATAITLHESLLILQAFVCIIVVTMMALNASIHEQKETELALRDIGNQLEERVAARTRELTEAAREIELVNRRLTEAQRLAHIGNWEWDIKRNRITWSDELFRIFGLDPQTFEASYESYLRYIHPEEYEKVNKIILDAFENHQPYDFYHRIVRPDGSVRILNGRGAVIVDAKGEAVSMAGTAQDVTEIKQAEQEIQQLADDLTKYNNQLEQKNRELESFTFVASHDLQEPLRKIQTFLSLIGEKETGVLSPSSVDYMKRTYNAAERMQQLINDLLVYSRTTGTPGHFQETDLNLVLEKVLQELKEVIDEKKAKVVSTRLPALVVIPFQFQQLFINILSNSLKFSRPGVPPEIRISSSPVYENQHGDRKKYLSLSIADNGIGFETMYNEKIFDLFQRLHTTERYRGTGIGLAICKKIMENHGGFIRATSEPGKGATFTIYLPDPG